MTLDATTLWTIVAAIVGLLALGLLQSLRVGSKWKRQCLLLQQQKQDDDLASMESQTAMKAQLAAMDEKLDEKMFQIDEISKQVEQYRHESSLLASENQRLKTEMAVSTRHHEQQVQLLDENKQALKQEFSNLANEILDAKGKSFSEQNQQQLDHLLKPFKEQLSEFKTKVESAQKEDNAGRAALKQQLESLHQLNQRITDEAANLTQALQGDKKMQGNWGELQVEKLLENSGLIKDQEYQREPNFKNEEGSNMRPDFIVHLPEGKHLIIDSKVSLVDYLSYVEADDDIKQEQALQRHIACIRNHIKSLSDKDYPSLPALQAPDFVFMFMPIEPSFIVAFQREQQLFSEAFDKRIVVVTPTTLLATLRTVANLWSIERQNANARKLAEKGASLYNKLRVFVEKMEKLDGQFITARKTYDEAMTTLKTGPANVVKQAQEFLELGVRVKKELPAHTVQTSDLGADALPEQPLEKDNE